MRNKYAHVPDGKPVFTCPGSKYHVLHEPRFDGKTLSLVEVGREEIQPKIEAYAPYTDLVYMLSRLKVNDFSVLNDKQPLYGDFSGMPTNPVDAINLVHSAEIAFNRLSADEKQSFNNDYRIWLSQFFSAERSPSISSDAVSDKSSVKDGASDEQKR